MAKLELTDGDFAAWGAPSLVYVREVLARELLEELADAPKELRDDPDAVLFAVHAADGQRLAVLDDRAAAFEAARGHELEPVSVH